MMRTPWGVAQTQKEIAPGIWQVTTAGHGGYFVEKALRSKLIVQDTAYSGNGWFEEDCDWAFVVLSFPEHFEAELIESAKKTIKSSYEGQYNYLFQERGGKNESI